MPTDAWMTSAQAAAPARRRTPISALPRGSGLRRGVARTASSTRPAATNRAAARSGGSTQDHRRAADRHQGGQADARGGAGLVPRGRGRFRAVGARTGASSRAGRMADPTPAQPSQSTTLRRTDPASSRGGKVAARHARVGAHLLDCSTRPSATATPSARNRRACSTSWPGTRRPVTVTTRHQGRSSGLVASSRPTARAAPGTRLGRHFAVGDHLAGAERLEDRHHRLLESTHVRTVDPRPGPAGRVAVVTGATAAWGPGWPPASPPPASAWASPPAPSRARRRAPRRSPPPSTSPTPAPSTGSRPPSSTAWAASTCG